MITGKGTYKRLTPEDKEVRKKTGANIRKLRSQAGYTQQRIEELLGMPIGSLSSVERGEAPIYDNFLTEFCKLLHATKDTVVWKPSEKKDDKPIEAIPLNELMHQDDGLPDEAKKRIEELEDREQQYLDKISWLENEAAHAEYQEKILHKLIDQQDETIKLLKRVIESYERSAERARRLAETAEGLLKGRK